MADVDELQILALDLKNMLVKDHRATAIDGPEPLVQSWRSWGITFTHRGIKRRFIYRVERQDPIATMYRALRADTNGELLVRIPADDLLSLLTNTIYYPPHG